MAKNNYEDEIKKLENDLIYLKNQNDDLKESISYIKQILRKNLEITSYCPICDEISKFESFGINPRPEVKCPNCGSLERHRLVYLLFQRRYEELLEKKIEVLHFAPEYVFYKFFSEKQNIKYYPVDINPDNYDFIDVKYKVDMQDIPFPSNKFDLIYNSHVLEHVPDDIKAMKELYRVLKRNGVCIILVPINILPETFENEDFNTPELKLKHFGQSDHLRKYALDIEDRLKSVGFNVEVIRAENLLNDDEVKDDIYRLCGEVVFVCTK